VKGLGPRETLPMTDVMRDERFRIGPKVPVELPHIVNGICAHFVVAVDDV